MVKSGQDMTRLDFSICKCTRRVSIHSAVYVILILLVRFVSRFLRPLKLEIMRLTKFIRVCWILPMKNLSRIRISVFDLCIYRRFYLRHLADERFVKARTDVDCHLYWRWRVSYAYEEVFIIATWLQQEIIAFILIEQHKLFRQS